MSSPNKNGKEAMKGEFFKNPSYVASWFGERSKEEKPIEQSKDVKQTEQIEQRIQLENVNIEEFKNVIVYGSESELNDKAIVKVIQVKTVYNKKNKAKLLIRYQLNNKIYSIFYGRAFLIAIANRLSGQIKTFKDLEGKSVVLEKHTVYIGNTARTHLIPTKVVK